MTDRIDLDELTDGSDDEREPEPAAGDWLWRDDGPPDGESVAATSSATADAEADVTTGDTNADVDTDATTGPDAPMPHVPRANRDRPVGIPKEGGGAGGAAATDEGSEATRDEGDDAAGPHGGDADDMTMALTYRAARRLAAPAAVFADAAQWADWVGIVGEVDAHVINKFQRDNHVDADFFNGSGTGPAERLAEIDEHSMFFADRMVVVGVDDERWLADDAGWEFVRLPDAAGKADWELREETP